LHAAQSSPMRGAGSGTSCTSCGALELRCAELGQAQVAQVAARCCCAAGGAERSWVRHKLHKLRRAEPPRCAELCALRSVELAPLHGAGSGTSCTSCGALDGEPLLRRSGALRLAPLPAGSWVLRGAVRGRGAGVRGCGAGSGTSCTSCGARSHHAARSCARCAPWSWVRHKLHKCGFRKFWRAGALCADAELRADAELGQAQVAQVAARRAAALRGAVRAAIRGAGCGAELGQAQVAQVAARGAAALRGAVRAALRGAGSGTSCTRCGALDAEPLLRIAEIRALHRCAEEPRSRARAVLELPRPARSRAPRRPEREPAFRPARSTASAPTRAIAARSSSGIEVVASQLVQLVPDPASTSTHGGEVDSFRADPSES
jgi:hypothetical protein